MSQIFKKRVMKFILTFTIVISGSMVFFPNMKADAAMSSWQGRIKGDSDCRVRVWTDATNYYRGATTVDWYAETNGKCRKLDYSAELVSSAHGIRRSGKLTGYFANRTPTKSFSIRNWERDGAQVFVDLYRNGKDVGTVRSKPILIYR